MRPLRPLLLAAALGGSHAPALAAGSPLDGTWRWDAAATQLSDRPDRYRLANGVYACESCVAAFSVPADGAAHTVPGQQAFDAVTATVVGANSVRLAKAKAGKPVETMLLTVSADGATLTTDQADLTAETPITSRLLSQRIGAQPGGAHPISGSWRQTRIEAVSDSGASVSLKVTDAGVSFRDPSGFNYQAPFDGAFHPVKGVDGDRSVKVRLIDPRTFEETTRRDGALVSVITLTVQPDGKTATFVSDDRAEGAVTRGLLRKVQP